MRKQWKRFMAWWMPIAEVIGNFMNRLVLSAFYFVIVLPFGLGVRLFSDPLKLRKKADTGWSEILNETKTVEKARKQF